MPVTVGPVDGRRRPLARASGGTANASEGTAYVAAEGQAGAGGPESIVVPGGLNDERVQAGRSIIVLNTSCTASAEARDQGVTDVTDAYRDRVPSKKDRTIARPRSFDAPGSLGVAPRGQHGAEVLLLHARWGLGEPTRAACSQPHPDAMYEVRSDSVRQRQKWFESGLQQLTLTLDERRDVERVAFQHTADKQQKAAIRAFARRHPQVRVLLVQSSRSMVDSMRQRAVEEHAKGLLKASQLARNEAEAMPAGLRQVSIALCDDMDRRLLSSPQEAPATLTATQGRRDAIAQVCLAHVQKGEMQQARELMGTAPSWASSAVAGAQVLLTEPLITLPGLEDWGDQKQGVQESRLSQQAVQWMQRSSCEWEWDTTNRTTGAYRWVEQITVTQSGEVRRTGVKRGDRYRMPEAARAALAEVSGGQFDALQHVRVAMERIERAQAEVQRTNAATDEAYRKFLRQQRDAGVTSPRTVCDALVGPERASAFIAAAQYSQSAVDGREAAEADDELMRAVQRVRSTQPNLTTQQVFAALASEARWATLELSKVRRASSKLTKSAAATLEHRTAGVPYSGFSQDSSMEASIEALDKADRFATADLLLGFHHGLGGAATASSNADNNCTAMVVWRPQGSVFMASMAAAPAPRLRVDVSSAIAGRTTPMRLRGLKVLGKDGRAIDIPVTVGDTIPDTGSCTGLAGLEWLEQLRREAPDAVEEVKPLPTSLGGVSGVGGGVAALFYVKLRLLHGDCELVLHDVPVVPNIPGLLVGTDTFSMAGASIQFYQGEPRRAMDGLLSDGDLTLRDAATGERSQPLPFTCRASTQQASRVGMQQAFTVEEAVAAAEFSASEELIKNATPVAINPEAAKVKAWSYRKIRCRVPHALLGDHEVCVVPLDDQRATDLGVHVHSTIMKPDKDGYIDVVLTNTTGREREVPMLSAVGRFMVDPTVEGRDIEFTTDEIMKLINIDPDASDDDLQLIREMIEPNRRLFATQLGYAHGYKMSIRTPLIEEGKALPPNAPNRNRSRDEQAALKESIDKQLKAGLIMPCRSPYNAQPVLVRKADWTPERPSYRVTLDFRPLNALTERDSYPLPNVEANLAALGKANRFTTADLLMGFHQCELDEHDGSRLKTAFGTPWGQFCYKRMPMGLTSSPGCFMRLVDSTLRGLPPGMALAYADDIIVPTAGDMKNHMQAVGVVFGRLIEAGFTVRCDKIHIGKPEVPYLGFLAGAQGTRPNPEKTKALLDMVVEQLIREPAAVGRFTGMMGVYARWVPNCQQLMGPMNDLRQKGSDHSRAESLKLRSAFAALLHLLVNATALARPDYEQPFYVDVDAATVGGVGAALSQRQVPTDDDTHKPLGFASHKFTDNERAFAIRDQECFGIYYALQQWRHILMGAKVVVRTDHKSLQWLMRTQHMDGSRVAGWTMRLQEYDLEIQWVPGSEMLVGDCISRAFYDPHSAQGDGSTGAGGENGGGGQADSAKTGSTPDAAEQREQHLDAVTLIAEANTKLQRMRRTALLVLDTSRPGEPRILVEKHDDIYTLPSVHVGTQGSYRAQLQAGLRGLYGDRTPLQKTLKEATSHRHQPRCTEVRTHLFMAHVKAPGADGWCTRGTGFVSLKLGPGGETLSSIFAEDDDRLAVTHACSMLGLTGAVQERCPWRDLKSTLKATLKQLGKPRSSSKVYVAQAENSAGANSTSEADRSAAIRKAKLKRVADTTFALVKYLQSQRRGQPTEEGGVPNTVVGLATLLDLSQALNHGSLGSDPQRLREILGTTRDEMIRAQRGEEAQPVASTAAEPAWARAVRMCVRTIVEGQQRARRRTNQGLVHGVVCTADALWDTHYTTFGIGQKPYGPALVVTNTDAATAVQRLWERLEAHPEASLAVDLEGELGGRQAHISLLQVCVDAYADGEEQLVYVFDTHVNRQLLRAEGPSTLRGLLESGAVPKVLHCCSGDASALYNEYGIELNCILDTGATDVLLRRGAQNVMRNLEVVLKHWLGKDAVQMALKGSMQFIPGMFNQRPLPGHLFVYAYQDVVYCNKAYQHMCAELRRQDLYELAFVTAQARSPAYTISLREPALYPADTRIVVALVDPSSVVCLCHKETRVCSLPTARASDITPITTVVKQLAQHVWAAQMGPPPKGVAAAVHARPRKPMQVGGTLLITATVLSCTQVLEALNTALTGSVNAVQHTVVVRSRLCQQSHSSGVATEQRALFQQLFVEADRQEHKRNRSVTQAFMVAPTATQPTERPTIKVHLQLSITGGRVGASTFAAVCGPTRSTATGGETTHSIGEANIVTGPTVTNRRGAIILHDGVHVFVLNGNDWDAKFSLPSHQVETNGTAQDAAIKGFDLMAGAALRRGGGGGTQTVYESYNLSPQLAPMLTRQFEAMKSIGTFGNTEFFEVVLEPGTMRSFAPAFYMARQLANGFRLTPTLQKRHVGFQLCRIGTALVRLQEYDAAALERAAGEGAATTVDSQSMGVALLTSVLQRFDDDRSTGVTTQGPDETADVAQQNDSTGVPGLGEDEDFDALFEAHALLTWYAFEGARGAQQNEVFAAGVWGTEAGPKPVTRVEMLGAQLDHPGTAQLLGYLQHGELAEPSGAGEAEELRQVAAQHVLAQDGLLLRKTPKGPRIVVPPQLQRRVMQQCHDGMGHFGVNKTFEFLAERFIWQGHKQMREQLRDYCKHCDICQRTNIHRHIPGAGTLAEHGEGPLHTWAMDVYSVGVESGGYDSTLNFMDLFSRLVVARPVDKHLDSVGVCKLLMKAVICTYGTPSAIRCDNASIFVSEVCAAFMKIYKIDLKASTSYHHRSIGALERFHSVLKKLIMAQRIASGDDEWHQYLPILVYCYNTTLGASGHSPFQVVYGQSGNAPVAAMAGMLKKLPQTLPGHVAEHLDRLGVVWDAQAQALMRNSLYAVKKMNLRHDAAEGFQVGDSVLLKKGTAVDCLRTHPKAVEVNDGPFTVVGVLPNGNLRLADKGSRRIKDVVAAARCTRYFRPDAYVDVQAAAPSRLHRRWGVDKIVGHRRTAAADKDAGRAEGEQVLEYCIRWAGLDRSYDKWHTAPYLTNMWELLDAYHKEHKLEQAPPLERETREIHDTPVLDDDAVKRAHFRPQDVERRRVARAEARAQVRRRLEPDVGTDTVAAARAGSSAQHAGAEDPSIAAAAPAQADVDADSAAAQARTRTVDADEHETRRRAREVARDEQLEAERLRREARAQALRGAGPTGAAATQAPEGGSNTNGCTQARTRTGEAGADGTQQTAVQNTREMSAEPQSGTGLDTAATQADSAHEVRRVARAAAREAQLEASRVQREQRAEALARRRAQANVAVADDKMTDMTGGTVKLVASDGTAFEVTRAEAMLSGTIKAMLTGQCHVEGVPVDEIRFAEITADDLRETVRYMRFKNNKKGGTTTAFQLEGAAALRIFRVAHYLDV